MNYQTWILAFIILVCLLVVIWMNGSLRDAVKGIWGAFETETAKKLFFFSLALLLLIVFAGSVAKRGFTIKDVLLVDDTPQSEKG